MEIVLYSLEIHPVKLNCLLINFQLKEMLLY